jgi:hypothetical protein
LQQFDDMDGAGIVRCDRNGCFWQKSDLPKTGMFDGWQSCECIANKHIFLRRIPVGIYLFCCFMSRFGEPYPAGCQPDRSDIFVWMKLFTQCSTCLFYCEKSVLF